MSQGGSSNESNSSPRQRNSSSQNGNGNKKKTTTTNKKNNSKRSYQSRAFASQANKNDDNWKVPSGFYLPDDLLEYSFVRSSGAGGQNVNKVNSQVQLKLNLNDANVQAYIPNEVVRRLKQQQANRINKQQELLLQVQEHRSQAQNKQTAKKRLVDLILQAWARPKVRKLYKGRSPQAKERHKEMKKRRSQTKENRKRVDF